MKKLSKKEKILLGASIVGIGVAGYFGYKILKKNPCEVCGKHIDEIIEVDYKDDTFMVELDFDIKEITMSIYPDGELNDEKAIRSINWFTMKHCPNCGRKLK